MRTLSREIERAERAVSTDSYDMSVGELINIYKDGEIKITPEYQRLFRWNIEQKTLFIESLLLGIPIPPIFVIEVESRAWELIDGLQRTSTILQFVNELRDPETSMIVPSEPLVAGRHLPALYGAVWEATGPEMMEISNSERIRLKRAKISIQILRRSSDQTSKYDLFQRLNSGGTKANRQELRNCMIVMQSPAFLAALRVLATDENFLAMFRLTPNQKSEQVDIEYLNRVAVLIESDIAGSQDVEDFFDDETLDLIQSGREIWQRRLDLIAEALGMIRTAAGDRALYKPRREGQSSKPPQNTALEVIVVGVCRNYAAIRRLGDPTGFLRDRIRAVWDEQVMTRASSSGVSGTRRLRLTIPFGNSRFDPDDAG